MYINLAHLYENPNAQILKEIYGVYGHELRFVGGCVRDTLLGNKPSDIDLATTLPPKQALEIFDGLKITAVPIGLPYGTILVVIGGQPFEITTLRKDIKTDGRHAVVTYTQNWEEDAERRDFTINAMYADFDNNLFDYFGGRQDLENGVIRFIGKPLERIQEDYLRILRFFRFYAYFGKAPLDPEALLMCSHQASHLQKLSHERITLEILKLLAAPDPTKSLHFMDHARVLSEIFSEYSLQDIRSLIPIEQRLSAPPHALTRLCLLTNDLSPLKLSHKQQVFLERIPALPLLTTQNIYRFLHQEGKALCQSALLFQSVRHHTTIEEAWKVVEDTTPSPFPLTGKDLLEAGFVAGPALGETLRACQNWWCDQHYHPTKDDCLKMALSLHGAT